jgi:hypothetical protein
MPPLSLVLLGAFVGGEEEMYEDDPLFLGNNVDSFPLQSTQSTENFHFCFVFHGAASFGENSNAKNTVKLIVFCWWKPFLNEPEDYRTNRSTRYN